MTDTPGERFAQAFLAHPEQAQVDFDFTLSDAFQPTNDRPRLTVRNLFRKQRADAGTVRSWFENRPAADEAARERRRGPASWCSRRARPRRRLSRAKSRRYKNVGIRCLWQA